MNNELPVKQKKGVIRKLTDDFLSGGIAGAVTKTIVAPVERVKLLLQLQQANSQVSSNARYRGMVDCFKRVRNEQGYLSFWRGNAVNIMRYFPGQAMNFTIWDRYREYFLSGVSRDDFWLYFRRSMLVGGLTGGTSLIILYPFDFARTRVGVDIGVGATRLFTGSLDCLKKAEGVKGVYKGFDIALFGIVTWRMLYFGSYDVGTNLFFHSRHGGTIYQRFFLAQAITGIAGSLVYPLDTLRRRMMMQAGQPAALQSNSLHCALTIARNEGFRGFYGGLSANLIRSFGGALMLVLFDEIRLIIS